MFIATILRNKDNVLEHVDLTGDKTDDVQLEVMVAAGGHNVIYIHTPEKTIFRMCRPKSIDVVDRRRSYLDHETWVKTIKVGYYWIATDGEPDSHRIIEVVRVDPLFDGAAVGKWRGNHVVPGIYAIDGKGLSFLASFSWKGFRAVSIPNPFSE